MKQHKIFEIELSYSNNIVGVKQSEPVYTYYSNLSLVVENLQKILAMNSWEEHNINYSAVYRGIKAKKNFVAELKYKGQKFFKINIRELLINPALTDLGISKRPY
jgi:hypothetical protein